MAEVEKTDGQDATSAAELRQEIRTLREQLREVNAEARDHRLEKKDAIKRANELENELKKGATPSKELETLRKENLQLKHRDVFKDVARDSGVKTSRKALDTLWDALKYESDKDADPADLKARIEAVRPDYDFLFDAAPAEDETPRPEAKPAPKPTPKPGPGVGRGAPADGTGTVKLRKSDLQSYDPKINPMLDHRSAARIKQAEADGKLQYIDE
jgi:myosin heavy subunit